MSDSAWETFWANRFSRVDLVNRHLAQKIGDLILLTRDPLHPSLRDEIGSLAQSFGFNHFYHNRELDKTNPSSSLHVILIADTLHPHILSKLYQYEEIVIAKGGEVFYGAMPKDFLWLVGPHVQQTSDPGMRSIYTRVLANDLFDVDVVNSLERLDDLDIFCKEGYTSASPASLIGWVTVVLGASIYAIIGEADFHGRQMVFNLLRPSAREYILIPVI